MYVCMYMYISNMDKVSWKNLNWKMIKLYKAFDTHPNGEWNGLGGERLRTSSL